MSRLLSTSEAERFLSKVVAGAAGECWPYLGARTGGRDGETYGTFRTSSPRSNVYAHRYAYALANGIHFHDIGRKTVIRHKCDNPICCNPSHLEPGTQAQNVMDKVERGRLLRGESVGNHKLFESDVLEIRQRLEAGETHECIAALYGVCRTTITNISNGKIWSWLADNDNEPADHVKAGGGRA